MLELLDRIALQRVLVFGDIFLDRYLWGVAERISPEAPIPLVQAERQEVGLGGAGAVASLARGLDARVTLAGIIGTDQNSNLVWDLLGRAGINRSLVCREQERCTPVKERVFSRVPGRGYQPLVRIDYQRIESITAAREEQFLAKLLPRLGDHDALLIADCGKGICTPRLLDRLLAGACHAGVPVLIDPTCSPDHRYSGADVLLPNRVEAETITGLSIRTSDDVSTAARRLRHRYDVGAVLLKLDRDGMALATNDQGVRMYPTLPRLATDGAGAGEMVLAMVGLCRAAGASWDETVRLANLAAGLEVQRYGITPISREELRAELTSGHRKPGEKILSVSQMASLAEEYRREGRTVVFTSGCFDLLHAGHTAHLQEASELGDVLVVAIQSDASVSRRKGLNRPLIGQDDRAARVAAIGCVDHVLRLDNDALEEVLRQVRPDVLARGGDAGLAEVVGREIVEEYGGSVCLTSQVKSVSTANLLVSLGAALSPSVALAS